MSEKNVNYAITGSQFTELVHRAHQATRYGDDPVQPADKLLKSWHRINTMAEYGSSERERRILSDALLVGAVVLRDAGQVVRSKADRLRYATRSRYMQLDAVQMGLGNSSSDPIRLRGTLQELSAHYGQQSPLIGTHGPRHNNNEILAALNTRSLGLQLQLEQAHDLPGRSKAAVMNVLQASLAGLVQESAAYLAKAGSTYAGFTTAGNETEANKVKGFGAELAYFTNQLTDWHERGVAAGNNVRLAVVREDQPHLISEDKRLGFDAVINDSDYTNPNYVQVKSSYARGGVPYVPEITVWRPTDLDFMTVAEESASWFGQVVGYGSIGSVALARHQLTALFGEPTQLQPA